MKNAFTEFLNEKRFKIFFFKITNTTVNNNNTTADNTKNKIVTFCPKHECPYRYMVAANLNTPLKYILSSLK